jgi:hypothetical protein
MNAYIENINEAITYIENVYNTEERKEYFRSLENGPLSNLEHCITRKSKNPLYTVTHSVKTPYLPINLPQIHTNA